MWYILVNTDINTKLTFQVKKPMAFNKTALIPYEKRLFYLNPTYNIYVDMIGNSLNTINENYKFKLEIDHVRYEGKILMFKKEKIQGKMIFFIPYDKFKQNPFFISLQKKIR